MGYSSDRGAVGAQCTVNKRPLGALCAECTEKKVLWVHNALNARLWAEIPVHVLIRVGGGGGF
jgi:hypothetical protein